LTDTTDFEDDHVSEIVLIRHGETQRNVIKRIAHSAATFPHLHTAGMKPDHLVELTELGVRQAKCIGKALHDELSEDCNTFDAYFDSGYMRTMQTLDAILEAIGMDKNAGGRRRSHLNLREREPGYTFNMTITDLNQAFPWYQEYAELTGYFYERPIGGESLAEMCGRVHTFLNSLRRARKGQRVLIVAHGHIMRAFEYWLNKHGSDRAEELFRPQDEKDRKIENCRVMVYVREGAQGNRRFKLGEAAERINDRYGKIMLKLEAEVEDARKRKEEPNQE
jgi:broad specificity phosphatase PhoE